VDGVDGCEVKFAKCCNPLPGDDIRGFITKGYGISIHKQDCVNLRASMANPDNAERFVTVSWDSGAESGNGSFEAVLTIHATPTARLITDVTMALSDMHVALLQISTHMRGDSLMILTVTISCKDLDHVNSIVSRLRQVKNVSAVLRGYQSSEREDKA